MLPTGIFMGVSKIAESFISYRCIFSQFNEFEVLEDYSLLANLIGKCLDHLEKSLDNQKKIVAVEIRFKYQNSIGIYRIGIKDLKFIEKCNPEIILDFSCVELITEPIIKNFLKIIPLMDHYRYYKDYSVRYVDINNYEIIEYTLSSQKVEQLKLFYNYI
jgi:hypothetical protein